MSPAERRVALIATWGRDQSAEAWAFAAVMYLRAERALEQRHEPRIWN